MKANNILETIVVFMVFIDQGLPVFKYESFNFS